MSSSSNLDSATHIIRFSGGPLITVEEPPLTLYNIRIFGKLNMHILFIKARFYIEEIPNEDKVKSVGLLSLNPPLL